ncbi:PqqA peptide cyclase [subsurface metagenome]
MKKAGITGVGISLDGIKKTHDTIRGYKGLFNRVINGITHILNADLPLTIITTVNALNIDELPSLLSLLESLGVKRWQIQPIFPVGRVHDFSELELTEEAYLHLGAFVKQYGSQEEKCELKILPSDSFGYFTEFDTRTPSWQGCPAGLVSCGITSDGKIKGCLSLPDEITEGDLRHQDLWDIWYSPNSFTFTRKFTKEVLGSNCRSCDRSEQCLGGCSAMSFESTGNFHNDPYCFYRIKKRNLET